MFLVFICFKKIGDYMKNNIIIILLFGLFWYGFIETWLVYYKGLYRIEVKLCL